MRTGKIQIIENKEDLELLIEGDIVDTDAFGNMVYFSKNNDGVHLIQRTCTGAILNTDIKNSKIKTEKGVLFFSGAKYRVYSKENDDGLYERQNELLKKLGL